jgi:tRNA A-37 threonylcarbamoyl transferase component Bud32
VSTDRLIGVGRTAEVWTVGEQLVAKVLLPGFDRRALEIEARKTQAAYDAGVKAPGTHGEMFRDGRYGYLFDRVDGDVMLDVLRRRPWAYRSHADVLSRVQAEIHDSVTTELPSVKDLLAHKIDQADQLDSATRRAAKDRLRELDDEDAVLHGDFHPGNVIISTDGPVVIDWLDASRGSPAADVARTLWLLTPAGIPPETAGRPLLAAFVTLFRRRYLATYLGRTRLDAAVVARWRLPVIAGRLSEGIDHETAPILEELARLTR